MVKQVLLPFYHYLMGIWRISLFCCKVKKGDIHIILTNNIGDDVYGLSLLKDFKEKKDCKIIVHCINNRSFIVEAFVGAYDNIKKYEKKSYAWKSIQSINSKKLLIDVARRLNVYSVMPYYYRPMSNFDGRNCLEIIYEDMLRMNKGIVVQTPCFEGVKLSLPYTNIDKIAVLNTASITMNSTDNCFFSIIATDLKKRGYIVYTNVVGDQQPVEGTMPLNVALLEFVAICNYVDVLISVRTGLLDLCYNTKCKKIVYYFPLDSSEIIDDEFYARYTLKAWEQDNIREFLYNDNVTAFQTYLDIIDKD